MTPQQLSHPECVPRCKAGHGARHIHGRRSVAAGGDQLAERCYGRTCKYADHEAALADWGRINRPPRRRHGRTPEPAADNVVQLQLRMTSPAPAGRTYGSC